MFSDEMCKRYIRAIKEEYLTRKSVVKTAILFVFFMSGGCCLQYAASHSLTTIPLNEISINVMVSGFIMVRGVMAVIPDRWWAVS